MWGIDENASESRTESVCSQCYDGDDGSSSSGFCNESNAMGHEFMIPAATMGNMDTNQAPTLLVQCFLFVTKCREWDIK